MRRKHEHDLQAELASHLELHIADGVRSGLTEAEARRRALLKLGGLEQTAERCRAQRGWPHLESLVRDTGYAARRLRKSPGAAALVVLTLALGIGATSAVFSLVYAALLRPLPFPQADRLVWISATSTRQQLLDQTALSPQQILDWQPELDRLFSRYAWLASVYDGVYRVNGVSLEPAARDVSGNLFSMLSVRPYLGRLLDEADVADHGRVAVLSYRFWREAYGGDPHAVGQSIRSPYGIAPVTIVGVLPPGFHLEKPTDIWFPAAVPAYRLPYRSYFLLGRRRAGVSIGAVRARMEALAQSEPAQEDHPAPGLALQTVGLREVMARGWRLPLLLLLAAVACLLLLACINVASLMLARVRQRRAELALRSALGASRSRLVQQLLVESGLLALAGGALGWAGAVAGLRLLLAQGAALLPVGLLPNFQMLGARGLAPAVITFTLLLTLTALMGFGLLPALRGAPRGLHGRMAAAGRVGHAAQMLVAAEVALAVILVAAAGLLAHSYANLASTDPGFQTQGRISVDVSMPILLCFKRPCTPETVTTTPYLEQLLQRLRALPGVTAAAGVGDLPLSSPTDIEPAATRMQRVFPNSVTDGYFATLGIPLLHGRDFNATDREGGPQSVIVNQTFVNTFFPGESVIGRKVQLARCGKTPCIIVGVAGAVRQQRLAIAPEPAAYVAFRQDPSLGATFVLRTQQSRAGVLPEVEYLLRSLPLVGGQQRPYVFTPHSLDETVALSIAAPRFRTWLSGLLAVLALLLAVVGIYGVESHAVSRRMHEIGVRMALGASPGEVRRSVLREALAWTGVGAAIGLPLAWALARMLASFLYQVRTWDPLTMAGVPLLLLAAGLLAAWVPARRAMRSDPLTVLRVE